MSDIVILGIFVADTAYRADRQPKMGETILGTSFVLGPGGKGSNQAVAAAMAGGKVTFISRLGKDAFADIARATWDKAGVAQSITEDGESYTGAAYIFLENATGNNAIIVAPGAAGRISVADIDALVALEQDCFTLDRLSPRNFNWMVRRANACLIVAEQQGHLAGYALLLFHRGTSLARLYSIAVSPTWRGHGLGQQLLDQAQANKELIRNLAHEIKNPLGGIRGSAQLLEMELNDKELTEYTQVIIHEADRLQTLVDRLLAPHRRPHVVGDVNIHEVCERVRALILAEFPRGLRVVRDYDISIPEFRGDREQLIQAVLNIAHNAAQALGERIAAGDGQIILRTRVGRQVTFGKQRYRLALELHVIDNGPGVPDSIKDRIFFPLVSGRDGGSGLGLTLAQTFVQQHHGLIECESEPGQTDFKILIPLP